MTCDTEPTRLISSADSGSDLASDKLAGLIRSANRAYQSPIDESAAWQRLQSRLNRPSESGWRSLTYAAVPLALAAGYLLYLKLGTEYPAPVASADPATVEVTKDAGKSVEQPVLPAVPSLPSNEVPASSTQNALEILSPRVDCEAAIKGGPPRVAASCLEQRTGGATLDAERAVVALARLKEERLHDPAGALRLLRTYRQRFPEGALRGEVDFALVALLPKVGLAREALVESEALLNTAWGRARTSELRLLRGRLAQDMLGDCNLALKELGFVKNEFGPTGDEAMFRSAQCLERVGERDAAKSTYQKYLSRTSARNASEANERLRALDAAP
jgi:hypothetical protein